MAGTSLVKDWAPLIEAAQREYVRRHPRSREIMQRMAAWMPGGDTRSTTWYPPFLVVVESAHGAELRCVDGETLLDFLGNYTSQIHGHKALFIEEAIRRAVERGFLFGAPREEQGALAELLTRRIPSAERVRFTSPGGEATMLAARIARRFTGRRRLTVARYSYHGSYEDLVWEAAERTGTAVFPSDVAGDSGAQLVFGEVMTVRLSAGGLQECCGVLPDLTTLGKIIGGGLPIGAVAGREDVMEVTDPHVPGHLEHGGTSSGNRRAMVAGLASLRALDWAAIERLNRLGHRLARGVGEVARTSRLPVAVTHVGSLLNLHAARRVRTPAEAEAATHSPLRRFLHLSLLNRGIFLPLRREMCVSTAMSGRTIATTVEALADALAEGERLLEGRPR